jgi:hypothetical protein
MRQPIRTLSEVEATLDSFHDCHVHGLAWQRDYFSFSLDLQYILQWIPPASATEGYSFLVADAQLTFQSSAEVRVAMDWMTSPLDAQIAAVRVLDTRRTPNGAIQRKFEIELADPEGSITLWSTGYEVLLRDEPVISPVPSPTRGHAP